VANRRPNPPPKKTTPQKKPIQVTGQEMVESKGVNPRIGDSGKKVLGDAPATSKKEKRLEAHLPPDVVVQKRKGVRSACGSQTLQIGEKIKGT